MWLKKNVQQMFTVFSLHQCLQRTVKNEQRQLSISNQHIRVPRWHAFSFAQVPFWCVLGMPSNSGIKAELKKKNTCVQKVLIFDKTAVHQLDLNPWPPECKSFALPIELYGCGFQWNVAWVFSNSSSSTHCRMQSDHHINLQWQTWSRRMMGLWFKKVNVGWPRWVIGVTDGQTDRHTDNFSALYMWPDIWKPFQIAHWKLRHNWF